jgi:hypothetical protein
VNQDSKTADNKGWDIAPRTASLSIAAGATGTAPFHMKGHAPKRAAVPHALVEVFTEGRHVLRHRIPVRAVPHAVCRKFDVKPVQEDLETQGFFVVGTTGERNENTRMAVARDETHLYIFVGIDNVDTPPAAPESTGKDDPNVRKSSHVAVLIDTSGAEHSFLQFCASLSAGRWDARQYYDDFLGHFARKADWNADWTTRTISLEDSCVTKLAIPFDALGAAPEPGATWRINVITGIYHAADTPTISSWSSSERAYTHPSTFGTLTFE